MPDLVQELSFYRKYHYNTVNVFIHVVCIPMILVSAIWLLTGVRVPDYALGSLDAAYRPYANAGMLIALAYGLRYIALDLPMGLTCAGLLNFAAYHFSTKAPELGSWGYKRAGMVHGLSWVAQFIGHGVFEHRAPALLDNLQQALVLAPFFAVFELFYFLGFRRDVIERVDQRVLPEIKAFHASRKAKAA